MKKIFYLLTVVLTLISASCSNEDVVNNDNNLITELNISIEGVYQRCMFVVALTNEFLKNIPNAPEGVDKERFAAEARFCRALAYYTLMDLFGIPPFITEKNYSMTPSPLSRAELFAWIESELLAVQGMLPVARQGE